MTDEVFHFGIRGMKWGVRKAKDDSGESKQKSPRFTGARTQEALRNATRIKPPPARQSTPSTRFSGVHAPNRPREARPGDRVDALVTGALNRGYDQKVGVAMAQHVMNIPSHNAPKDPATAALLSRVLTQSVNRTEEAAGREFMAKLPRGY